ncbi:MAG: hypothetical protein NC411_04665 [Bacteroides sp.]|nr:hypothetical protein [Bacteroides sp.]
MNYTDKTNRKTYGESTRRAKEKWDFPVSQKFYMNLCHRIEMILQALNRDSQSIDHLQSIVDAYLGEGETPSRQTVDEQCLTIFLCLKHDIDLAIERSTRAKARAAERRAQKNAAKNQTEVNKAESDASTQTASNEETPQNHRKHPKKKVKSGLKNQQVRMSTLSYRRASERKHDRKFHKIKLRTPLGTIKK